MQENPLKIMFVCLGNICRSPLAHAVLEKRLAEDGLDAGGLHGAMIGVERAAADDAARGRRGLSEASPRAEVESSGIGSWHLGELPDPRMRRVAARHGVRMSHRVRRISAADLDEYTLVLAMDRQVLAALRELCGGRPVRACLGLFREYDPEGGPWAEVPDPYYGGEDGFERVYEMVDRTCRELARRIRGREL